MGACIGPNFPDEQAIGAANYGLGSDVDSAVLAATNFNSGQQLRVTLSFSCQNLPDMDFLTVSDPVLLLFKRQGNLWNKMGQTEVIHDTLNPDFVTKLTVDYNFECYDLFKVEIYDIDYENYDEEGNYEWEQQDYIGWCEFYIHEVVSNPDQTMRKRISNPKKPTKKSFLTVQAEEKGTNYNKEICIFQPAAIIFKLSQGTYFFMIFKSFKNKSFLPIYKSEFKPSVNQEVKWNTMLIGVSDLCNDDPDQPIKIEVFLAQKSGKHKFISNTVLTFADLQHGDFIELEMTKCRFYITDISKQKTNTFLEYVFGGINIDLTIAIDLTLSNGDPNNPDSLHYLDPSKNQYLTVIKSVGSIIQYYNTNKLIHLYGFGCGVPPYNTTQSSCVALNGNIFDPRVDGIQEVIECYKNAIQNVALYGPTYFNEILQNVNGVCELEPGDDEDQKFQVVLFLTDGGISDFQRTIDQIVRGSKLPVSIIIVGIGKKQFEEMEILDGDVYPIYSEKYQSYCEADIVQFVLYEQFKDTPYMLAKEVLKEFPTQLLNYMRKRGIEPIKKSEKERLQKQAEFSQMQFSKFSEIKKSEQRPQLPLYLQEKKKMFLKEVEEAGLDMQKVNKFLETHGLYETRMQILIDNLDNEKYVNPLKIYPVKQITASEEWDQQQNPTVKLGEQKKNNVNVIDQSLNSSVQSLQGIKLQIPAMNTNYENSRNTDVVKSILVTTSTNSARTNQKQ